MLFKVVFNGCLNLAVRRTGFAGILYEGAAFAEPRNDIFDVDV
jgi:hypothetical protein